MKNETAKLMTLIRERAPLVLHITNSVTVNDCACAAICAGGSPVMSGSAEDAAELAALAGAVVLNIGTVSDDSIEVMIKAGKAANVSGRTVILDPVGAGATRYRTDAALRILDEVNVSIIKGNAGEIGTLAGAGGRMKGVDSEGVDGDPVEACVSLSKSIGAVVVMTGPVDIVTDGTRIAVINNGHAMMGRVSGTGCMVSSVIGCYASCTDDAFTAAAAALAVFGIAGSKAAKRTKGPGSFLTDLKDELSSLSVNEVIPLANIRLM
ncbi:MAG: hydroxyethylthiazole kinase [Methanomassiliicoccaceae archaeon]|nr:hydroxyethylthiazole kinase [Methanomassiliicoccaceae archaeon]